MDTDSRVFLVMELTVVPGTFEKLKAHRMRVNAILEKYQPQYVFHNHAMEWLLGGGDEELPTGIEIIGFENEDVAREAFSELINSGLQQEQKELFSRVRCYLSQYDFPESLLQEMRLK